MDRKGRGSRMLSKIGSFVRYYYKLSSLNVRKRQIEYKRKQNNGHNAYVGRVILM